MDTKTKMTVKVHSANWDRFEAEVSSLPIKRNPFLNLVIRMETPRLREAVAGRKLSSKAHGWISGRLHSMKPGLKAVSIDLDRDVAQALSEVVQGSNLVRDAFFNRLVAFLRASDALLKYFDLPLTENRTFAKSYGNYEKPISPLRALSETLYDPLWSLHTATEELHGTSPYLLNFPQPTFDGFTCWIDDEDVPNTTAFKKKTREQEQLSKLWAEIELDAFTIRKVGGVA